MPGINVGNMRRGGGETNRKFVYNVIKEGSLVAARLNLSFG